MTNGCIQFSRESGLRNRNLIVTWSMTVIQATFQVILGIFSAATTATEGCRDMVEVI